MSEQPQYDANSEAVRAHLSIIQGVVNRMAGSSASCKNWCVVLVAAILVLVARTDTTDYALLSLLPTLLFLFLDAYYLALEQGFRDSYNAFVRKLHDNEEVELSDLYTVEPGSRVRRQLFVNLIKSFSIWPFYLMLVIAIALVWQFNCIKTLLGF